MFRVIEDITYEDPKAKEIRGENAVGGTNNDFVYRSSIMDFETGTQLTVYESQEALFYLDGACVGVLGPGKHVLDSKRIPFLSKLISKITKNQYIFHAQIYFVNKVELDMKWGVGDITYEDAYGPVFQIGANGQMNLTATDSRRLVEKLVGNDIRLTKEQIVHKFRDLITPAVTSTMLSTMREKAIPITKVHGYLNDISEAMYQPIGSLMANYGFSLERFAVSAVKVPTDNPEYRRLCQLISNKSLRMSELEIEQQEAFAKAQIEATKQRFATDAKAYDQQRLGYTRQEEMQYAVAKALAENENSAPGGMVTEMAQMGLGFGIAGTTMDFVKNQMGANNPQSSIPAAVLSSSEAASQLRSTANPKTTCPNCGMILDGNSKFCPECGKKLDVSIQEMIKCPKCNSIVRLGKFCSLCGCPLVSPKQYCSNCHEELPAGTKFCANCGAPVVGGDSK